MTNSNGRKPTTENGVWRGRTDASITGLAQSLDRLHAQFDRIPCARHGERIAQNRTAIVFLWGASGLLAAAVGGLAVIIIRTVAG